MRPATTRYTKRLMLATAILAIGLLTVVAGHHSSRASGMRPGPLKFSSSGVDLVFPVTSTTSRQHVTGGSILLCTQEGANVRLLDVRPASGRDIVDFGAFVRLFTIDPKARKVAEPIGGAYGRPPRIGGSDNADEDELAGALSQATSKTIRVPRCEESTAAPGQYAAELLVSIAGDARGASFDGLRVTYAIEDTRYQTSVDFAMTLCGQDVTDRDCR